jgi:hypothetical protein
MKPTRSQLACACLCLAGCVCLFTGVNPGWWNGVGWWSEEKREGGPAGRVPELEPVPRQKENEEADPLPSPPDDEDGSESEKDLPHGSR